MAPEDIAEARTLGRLTGSGLFASWSEKSRRMALAVVLITSAYVASALLPVRVSVTPDVGLTVACGFVLACAITLVGARLSLSHASHFGVWFTLIFLNLAAVAVEGSLFAPAAAPASLLAANVGRLAVVAVVIAGVIASIFGSSIRAARTSRKVNGWWWRLFATATVYLVLYLVLGGINYSLVTHPYYESHAGSLTVPPAGIIFLYEPVRGFLIALSLWPFIAIAHGRTAVVAIVGGSMLFIVGGLVPLLPQSSLPLYLRVASLWEILGQNFLTGIAATYLLRPKQSASR